MRHGFSSKANRAYAACISLRLQPWKRLEHIRPLQQGHANCIALSRWRNKASGVRVRVNLTVKCWLAVKLVKLPCFLQSALHKCSYFAGWFPCEFQHFIFVEEVNTPGLLIAGAGRSMLPGVSAVQGSAEQLAERSSIPAARCASASELGHSASPAASSSGASHRAAATTTQPFPAPRVTQQLEASTSGHNGSGVGFGGAAQEREEQRGEPLASGGSVRAEAKRDQRQVADKLIAVFQERESDGWRRLIASSQLWPTLADGCAQWLRGSWQSSTSRMSPRFKLVCSVLGVVQQGSILPGLL